MPFAPLDDGPNRNVCCVCRLMSTEAARKKASLKICRCAHGLEHHPQHGPCLYGHATAFGGCKCPGWHPRGGKYRPHMSTPPSPSAEARKRGQAFADGMAEGLAAPVTKSLEEAGEAALRAVTAASSSITASLPLTTPQKRLLNAIAISKPPMHKKKLALMTGYSPSSGGYGQALADLRSSGFIAGRSDAITLTDSGRIAAGKLTPLPTGSALLDWWCGKRPDGEADVLVALAQHRTLSRDALAHVLGRSPTSGGFGQVLANLRRLGLIDGTSTSIHLATELRD
jgi:hypothetical protein